MKRTMFYVMSLTWGLPLTICGAVVALLLIVTGHRPIKWGWCWYFILGRKAWGGLNLGLFFFTDGRDSTHTKNHEFGHAIQNCRYGPAMLLLVLCSSVRYHYINYLEGRGKPVPSYDSWWFEGQATELGYKYYIGEEE